MSETKRVVWVVDGEPSAGTFGHYAKDREHGHYAGLNVSEFVWWFDGDGFAESKVGSSSSQWDDDDYMSVTLRAVVDGEVLMASYRLDGRA